MKNYNLNELIEYAEETKYTPLKEYTRKLVGCYYNHIPELVDYNNNHVLDGFYNDGLIVKTIAHFDYDGRRYWNLSMVYFKDISFMMVQNAGREGDDHAHRFIFNDGKYKEIIAELSTIENPSEYAIFDNAIDGIILNDDTTIVEDLEEYCKEYTQFYGNDIENSACCDY
jgi:hypothetical protein